MLIPFVWLYMFKCDVYTQLLSDQTQKYFWVFYMFLKVFLCFCVFIVLFKHFISFLLKNSFRGIFTSKLWVSPTHENEDGKILENTEIQTESFVTGSQKRATRENCLYALMAISRITSPEAYPRNAWFCSF